MSTLFRCPACNSQHPSRLWAPDDRWLTVFLSAAGGVLEPCPVTGEWVKVTRAEAIWAKPTAPRGQTEWLPAACSDLERQAV